MINIVIDDERINQKFIDAQNTMNEALNNKIIYNVEFNDLKAKFAKVIGYVFSKLTNKYYQDVDEDTQMLILYSRPESISTVKSFRNKLKRPNHVPKEYADMVNVFYPITVNMDELKKFVVKGRRPSGKIAIENPNKIIMTCPCCGRKIAVGTNDRMVNHGFQRPGYGWLVGNCIGVNHKPLEVSDEGLRYMVELLTNEHEKLIEKSIKLSTCNSFTVYEFKKYVTYTKGDDFFELKLLN
jgi:hypothetical protein